MSVLPGSLNVSLPIELTDPSTNGPNTGLTIADLEMAYTRPGSDVVTSGATALALVTTAHTDNYAIEIDATDTPGTYRFDFPDAAFASGVSQVQLTILDGTGQRIGGQTVSLSQVDVRQINGALTDGSPAVASRPILYLQQLNAHCNIAAEGALELVNDHASGYGSHCDGGLHGFHAIGDIHGMFTVGTNGSGLSCEGDFSDITLVGTGTFTDIALNPVSVNTIEISGDSTAANNLELQYDGTGLSGGTFPATQNQVTGIANVGAATNTPAIDAPGGFTKTTGGVEVNDEDATHALDGITHDIPDDGIDTLDCYYIFDLEGVASPVSVTMTGRVVNASNSLGVYVNAGGTIASPVWEQRDTLPGQGSSTNFTHTFTLFTGDLMTGADAGKVALRFFDNSLSSATLYVDQIFCSMSADVSITGYANGTIWIDTINGVAGTVVNVNGTADNPSSNLTDALALSTATNLRRFTIVSGSTVPLIDDASGMVGIGETWNLGLEGELISGATVVGANVYNSPNIASTLSNFSHCHIANNAGVPAVCGLTPVRAMECSIDNTLTLLAAGNYQFVDCTSGVAGAAAPTIDLGAAIGGSNVEFRRWSGGLTLTNVNTGDVVSVDALTGGTLTLTIAGGTVEARGAGMKALVVNGSSGTVNVAGFYGTITDNSAGAVTITPTWAAQTVMQSECNDALVALKLDHLVAVADADDAVDNSIIAKLAATGGDWSTFVSSTDSLQAIRDRGDTAWITGSGAGSGARTVTVTVDDGVTALENAIVRFTEGVNTYTGSTNASGVIVFSLDDATYTVSISKAGYTFTPTSKIVNGTEADTYSMTAVAITAPPNASTITGVMTVYDEEGSVESGVTITVQIIDGPGTAGIGYDSTEWAATSNGSGVVEFAGIILGARYKIWRGTSKPEAQTFTAPTTGTSFDLAEVIGRG